MHNWLIHNLKFYNINTYYPSTNFFYLIDLMICIWILENTNIDSKQMHGICFTSISNTPLPPLTYLQNQTDNKTMQKYWHILNLLHKLHDHVILFLLEIIIIPLEVSKMSWIKSLRSTNSSKWILWRCRSHSEINTVAHC